jgi:hypothetical protein
VTVCAVQDPVQEMGRLRREHARLCTARWAWGAVAAPLEAH